MKKVLVLGGTGAMGVYMVPLLIDLGYQVFVTSRRDRPSYHQNLQFIKMNALTDLRGLKSLVAEHNFSSIIDFMSYGEQHFSKRIKWLLNDRTQYIFVSSCRVFADTPPITEDSPRLLEVSTDENYLRTREYALAKARQENLLQSTKNCKFTIVRPHLTFSKNRFQLVTLEAPRFLNQKIFKGAPVILPCPAMHKQISMTHGKDVALMISRLVCNEKALGTSFNLTTHEHHSWETIANFYSAILKEAGHKLNLLYTEDIDHYLQVNHNSKRKYQLIYGRMFNRVMDNSKILEAADLTETDITPFFKAMEGELVRYLALKG